MPIDAQIRKILAPAANFQSKDIAAFSVSGSLHSPALGNNKSIEVATCPSGLCVRE